METSSLSNNALRMQKMELRDSERNQVIREVIDRLVGAVGGDDDGPDEYDILASIINRAGLGWKCMNRKCKAINHNNCQTCDVCNNRRPKLRDAPEVEDMTGISLEYQRKEQRKLAAMAKENKSEQQ